MAARATRSASRGSGSVSEPRDYRDAERTLTALLELLRVGRLPAHLLPLVNNFHNAVSADPAWRCHLLVLSHDALGVIFDGLTDTLQPVIAVAFSSTCKGLWTPLRAALAELRRRHTKAKALWYKADKRGMQCFAVLRGAQTLSWEDVDLTADDMATLAMILRTSGLPNLISINLERNRFGIAGMQALCEGLAQSSITHIHLGENDLGTAGAEALGAVLDAGGLPKLEVMTLGSNNIDEHGVAALSMPLRKHPKLQDLNFEENAIGDDGLALLVDDLGKDDFKALIALRLHGCDLTDDGCAKLVSALDNDRMPSLVAIFGLYQNPDISDEAYQAVQNAVLNARVRTGRWVE